MDSVSTTAEDTTARRANDDAPTALLVSVDSAFTLSVVVVVASPTHAGYEPTGMAVAELAIFVLVTLCLGLRMRQHLATEALEETNGLVCVHATGEDVGHGRARLALVHVDADDAVFADSSVRPNIVIGLAVQPACGVTGILFELQGLELQGRVWLVRPAAMRIIEDVQIHDTRLDCRRRRGYNGREHTHRSEHAERRHCGRNGRRRRRLRSRRGGGAGGCAALVAWPLPEPTGAAAADPRQAPRRQQQGSQRQREPPPPTRPVCGGMAAEW
eukprot:CAMPEP_0177473812 /NCGR_PEP_ID=MMETSP0369-20130122/22106_1 /TAXON_ID=447022 ORGANISM="Scrippsiella hangoei-like, Strain SHHI-4" /NCGR_SAMPLE_ID=MMETSP0369 /ASSEMBLY_ACC=CAM_ASM_000364 /LENGTH=271 /DNA_ID=CAMNT_0018948707 /DNA_START=158 /DNA_END=969 /DNA_ORIENTATION=-